MAMVNIFVVVGDSYNAMIYLDEFLPPHPQTVFARYVHQTVGSTAASKALNLSKLGFDVTLFDLVGADSTEDAISKRFADEELRFYCQIDPAGTK